MMKKLKSNKFKICLLNAPNYNQNYKEDNTLRHQSIT